MKRRIPLTVAALLMVVFMMFSLTSCFYGTSTSTEEATTDPIPEPETVLPAEAAGDKIDLKADDPSVEDVITFTKDDDGKITECSYKSGDVSYYVGYTYGDKEVNINLFATDKDGNAFVLDARDYKTDDFNKDSGMTERDGYYFCGFKTLEEVKLEPPATETESSAESDSETAGDTTETASGTDTAEESTAPAEESTDTASPDQTETDAPAEESTTAA